MLGEGLDVSHKHLIVNKMKVSFKWLTHITLQTFKGALRNLSTKLTWLLDGNY